MKIDHINFYVEDAKVTRDWLIDRLDFQSVASGISQVDTYTEVIKNGSVYFVLSSPLTTTAPVAQFLRHHPPGVADIAFQVEDVETVINRAKAYGVKVLQPIQQRHQGDKYIKWGKIAAWGSLSHTIIQQSGYIHALPEIELFPSIPLPQIAPCFTGIDHLVLNVATGDLARAVEWYKYILGFRSQQVFKIQTEHSALHSQVMVSATGDVQLPINEPASPSSQIQEFLDVNRGAGIQHIALQTPNLVPAIAQLRSRGLALLPVVKSYYSQLQQRRGLPLSPAQLQEIAQAEILVDWQETSPQALLLQIFSQPIFRQPTFFFEFIERRCQAQGFGEGNFQALFEAIESEQQKRGSLNV